MSKKKILVCVTGESPAVVTETLYALGKQAGWLPREVHIITTQRGANAARQVLLEDGPENQIRKLCQDYGWPMPEVGAEFLHLISEEGEAREDIRGRDGSDATADIVLDVLRKLTAIENSELHFSIAGGRKTMTFYLGYIGALLARPQDRMSHTLVTKAAEMNHNFFYPAPEERWLESTRAGQPEIDASQMKVDLVPVPFIALREELPRNLLTESNSYSKTLEVINSPPALALEIRRRGIGKGFEALVHLPNVPTFTLEAKMFSVYWYLSKHDLSKNSDAQDILDDYVDVYACLLSKTTKSKKLESIERVKNSLRVSKEKVIDQMLDIASKIGGKLAEHVDGYFLVKQYIPSSIGPYGQRYFTLKFDRSLVQRQGQSFVRSMRN